MAAARAAGRTRIGERARRRTLTPLLVGALHIALLLGMRVLAPDAHDPRATDPSPLQTFLWIPPARHDPPRAARPLPTRTGRPRASTAVAQEPDTPPAAAAPAPTGAIDWEAAGREAARAHAQLPEPRRDCDENPPPGSMRPRCRPAPHAFGWHREPRAVEWQGLLPFVHLGKRCVLGLGFFGCAVGKLPEADGHLLDGMREPDRERSSVPAAGDAASR
jgi:hypothetical protein